MESASTVSVVPRTLGTSFRKVEKGKKKARNSAQQNTCILRTESSLSRLLRLLAALKTQLHTSGKNYFWLFSLGLGQVGLTYNKGNVGYTLEGVGI